MEACRRNDVTDVVVRVVVMCGRGIFTVTGCGAMSDVNRDVCDVECRCVDERVGLFENVGIYMTGVFTRRYFATLYERMA